MSRQSSVDMSPVTAALESLICDGDAPSFDASAATVALGKMAEAWKVDPTLQPRICDAVGRDVLRFLSIRIGAQQASVDVIRRLLDGGGNG
jgi:hypothetical protein